MDLPTAVGVVVHSHRQSQLGYARRLRNSEMDRQVFAARIQQVPPTPDSCIDAVFSVFANRLKLPSELFKTTQQAFAFSLSRMVARGMSLFVGVGLRAHLCCGFNIVSF